VKRADALRLADADNVAVLLRDAAMGEKLTIRTSDGQIEIVAREAVPLGHKIALASIQAGGSVMKYGSVIGEASRSIAPGDHAHVHNLTSRRARLAS
jgi:altronate dehydratase small subunit